MRATRTIAIVILLSSLTWMGCDESVDPVLQTDEAFTFYGFLDPSSDIQAIRVFEIEGTLTRTTTDPLDAVVQSTNLRSGETAVWQDSVITYLNNTVGHVFYANFQAEHGTPYEITATTNDGRQTRVQVTTPPDGVVAIEQILSTRSQVQVDLNWSAVPRVIQAEVSYFVSVPFPDGSDTTTVRVDIPSGRVGENSDGSWRVTILPSADIAAIFSALNVQPGRTPVFLDNIEVRAFVTSEDWESPVGAFDPELLVQPGTFSNVEDGFGFVGGGYFDPFELQLDDSVARDAGFSIR